MVAPLIIILLFEYIAFLDEPPNGDSVSLPDILKSKLNLTIENGIFYSIF
jgi:hypothetical protein